MVDKKFWQSSFTLTGTIVGAGILGLPYVFSKSGFLIGLFWLIFIGLILMYINLCLGEVALRTKTKHQLTGYASKYLGKWGARIMLFSVIFGIYSALIAYMTAEGQSLSMLFIGHEGYALLFGICFWIVMTLFLQGGLEGLKKVEMVVVSIIILLIIAMFLYLAPNIKIENISYYDFGNLFFPFGVVMFSLLGFSSIAEVRRELEGAEKKMKQAIIIGCSIPIVLYILFTIVFVGIMGKTISEVATLTLGTWPILLGVFTMTSAFFVLSFSLRDNFILDLRFKKLKTFFFVSIVPLVLYIIIQYLNLFDFVKILGIGGVITGGLTGVMALLMNISAKKNGNRKPEYSVGINWLIFLVLSLVFVFGIILELY